MFRYKIDSLQEIGHYASCCSPIRYSGNIVHESDSPQVVHPITHVDAVQTPVDPVRLTRALCEIESTTYNEGAVGDFLADYLAARGWAVEKTPVPQPAENANGGERWNVFATVPGKTPDVVFSTHMDTVPPHIPFTEDEEFMYGRGVSDAKGIIATQVAAAEALRAEGIAVGMLYVSGEERDSAGAREANKNPRGSRFLINGEPTDNRIALASKGALRRCV